MTISLLSYVPFFHITIVSNYQKLFESAWFYQHFLYGPADFGLYRQGIHAVMHSNCMTDHHHSPYTHCSSEKCHFQ